MVIVYIDNTRITRTLQPTSSSRLNEQAAEGVHVLRLQVVPLDDCAVLERESPRQPEVLCRPRRAKEPAVLARNTS